MSRELICAIDDFRFDKRLASRSEAIRRLIELGLKAAEREKERT
jgi:metal-responsive CopG/Arc/MetJ family transcriptional regulator